MRLEGHFFYADITQHIWNVVHQSFARELQESLFLGPGFGKGDRRLNGIMGITYININNYLWKRTKIVYFQKTLPTNKIRTIMRVRSSFIKKIY